MNNYQLAQYQLVHNILKDVITNNQPINKQAVQDEYNNGIDLSQYTKDI